MSTCNGSFTCWLLNVVTSQEVFQLKVQLEIQWLRGNEFVKLLVTQRYIIERMRRRSWWWWYYGRVLTCADVVNHQCSSYIDVLLNWFSPVISTQHIHCPRSWWFAFKVLQWTYWGRSTIIWGVHTTAACFCWHLNVLVAVFYFCIQGRRHGFRPGWAKIFGENSARSAENFFWICPPWCSVCPPWI